MASELSASLGAFEIKATDLLSTMQVLLGRQLDAKAAEALRRMIEEADKDFNLVVDALLPLYTMRTEADLKARWGDFYAGFKGLYVGQWHSLATQCGTVMDQLNRLKNSNQWKKRIPFLCKAVTEIEELGKRWMCDDSILYSAMQAFMSETNGLAEAVNGLRSTPKKALAKIRGGIADTEAKLLRLRSLSQELKRVGSRLLPAKSP